MLEQQSIQTFFSLGWQWMKQQLMAFLGNSEKTARMLWLVMVSDRLRSIWQLSLEQYQNLAVLNSKTMVWGRLKSKTSVRLTLYQRREQNLSRRPSPLRVFFRVDMVNIEFIMISEVVSPEGSQALVLEVEAEHGLVLEELVDALLDGRCDLLVHFNGLDDVHQLLLPRGARDGHAHVLVLDHPRHRQLRLAASQLLRDLAESLQLSQRLFLALLRVEEFVHDLLHRPVVLQALRVRQSPVLLDPVVVLAREQPLEQRRPHRRPHLVLLEQPVVLHLEPLPVVQVVLRLLRDRLYQVQLLAHPVRFQDLQARPLARRPVVAQSLSHAPVESSADLFHRGLVLTSMGVVHVHVVQLESLQGVLQSLDDVLPREVSAVREVIGVSSEEDLGGDDEVGARDVEFFEGLAELSFGLSPAVDLGRVEEVDAEVPGLLDALLVPLQLLGELGRDPVAVPDDGDLQA